MALFGLIVTPGDFEASKATMNSNYTIVSSLAAQTSNAGKLSENLASRLNALDTEVKEINAASVSMFSSGDTILQYKNRADAVIEASKQLSVELSSILGITSPLQPSMSVMGTILALGVTAVAGYWIYKWATQPEPYPRRLAPQYAGGYRRGRRR